MESIFKKVITDLYEGVFAITLKDSHYDADIDNKKSKKEVFYGGEQFTYEVIYGSGSIAIIEIHKYEKKSANLSFVDFYQLKKDNRKLLLPKIYNHNTQEWLEGKKHIS